MKIYRSSLCVLICTYFLSFVILFSQCYDNGAEFPALSSTSSDPLPTTSTNTKSTTSEEDTPPIILNVQVSDITVDSATISWETSESTKSQLEYGTDTAYGTSIIIDNYASTHSNKLSGLSSDTTYHFRIIAIDEGAFSTTSIDYTFDTPDTLSPEIKSLSVIDITTDSAKVVWATNENSTSKVEYGTNTSYGFTEEISGYTTSHQVPLSELTSNTVYHYRIITTDEVGNTTTSPDYVFYTGDCVLCGVQEKPDPVIENPVIDQNGKAYYPTVVYDVDHFGNNQSDVIKTEGTPGTDIYQVTPYYKMWYGDNSTPTNCNFAYSEDGIAWYHAINDGIAIVPSPPGGYHANVLYNSSGWVAITGRAELNKKYLIWVWDSGSKIYLYGSDDGITLTEISGSSGSDWNNYPGATFVYSMTVIYDSTDPTAKFKAWGDGNTGLYYYSYSNDARNWANGTLVTICSNTCSTPKWETTLSSDLSIGATQVFLTELNALSYVGNGIYSMTIDPGGANDETVAYTRTSPANNYLTASVGLTKTHMTGELVTQPTFLFTNGSCTAVKNEDLGQIEIWFSTNAYGKGITTGSSNKGIGYARTTNGYEWEPIDNIPDSGQKNPILSTNDGLNPNRNVDSLTGYTYSPFIIYDKNRFSGHGEARQYKLWFSGGKSSGDSRRVFYLSFDGASF